MHRSTLILAAGYILILALTTWGMSVARRRVVTSLDVPQATADWEVWREETVRQSEGTGPVKRRPAKAPVPPMLILMRDHFAAATITTLLAVTVFYWFLAVVLRGSLRSPTVRPAGHIPRSEPPQ